MLYFIRQAFIILADIGLIISILILKSKGYISQALICAFALILISTYGFYNAQKIKAIKKEMKKCSKFIATIENIVRVTAMNYFYAKKLNRKFDIEKIEEKLDKSELQIITFTEMLSDDKNVTDEEITESINYMKNWHIDIIHSMLTMSLSKGLISGEERRLLIQHGISGINNIDDNTFEWQKKVGDQDYYKMKLIFDD